MGLGKMDMSMCNIAGAWGRAQTRAPSQRIKKMEVQQLLLHLFPLNFSLYSVAGNAMIHTESVSKRARW